MSYINFYLLFATILLLINKLPHIIGNAYGANFFRESKSDCRRCRIRINGEIYIINFYCIYTCYRLTCRVKSYFTYTPVCRLCNI